MIIPFHDDNPIQIWPVVTVAIIVINVAMFLWSSQLEDHDYRLAIADHAFIPARMPQLANDQLIVNYDLYPEAEALVADGKRVPVDAHRFIQFQPDRGDIMMSLVSAMFMHAGIPHLLGNMWFFWIFGNNIEDRLGHVGFLFFYLVGGIVASACHWLLGGGGTLPVIGASGAVAATLGAYAVLYPLARVRTLIFLVFFTIIEIPALIVLGLWFGVQLFQGLVGFNNVDISGGVAWWAHIGGFLFGVILMPLISMGTPEPGEDWKAETDRQFDFDRMMGSD